MLLFIWAEPRGGGHSARVQGGRHWKEVESREKEDISLELVSAGRGRAPFQLAWQLYQGMCVTGGLGGAMHRASAQRQSNVISPMDWGVVCPPFTTLKVFPLLRYYSLLATVVDRKPLSPHCARLHHYTSVWALSYWGVVSRRRANLYLIFIASALIWQLRVKAYLNVVVFPFVAQPLP